MHVFSLSFAAILAIRRREKAQSHSGDCMFRLSKSVSGDKSAQKWDPRKGSWMETKDS